MLADPVSESFFVHLGVSAMLGLFSILLLVAFVVNSILSTFRRLQPVRRPSLMTGKPSAASASILMRCVCDGPDGRPSSSHGHELPLPCPILFSYPSIVCASPCLLLQVSGITTVLSSAALVLFLQRFSQVSPLQQTLTVRLVFIPSTDSRRRERTQSCARRPLQQSMWLSPSPSLSSPVPYRCCSCAGMTTRWVAPS